MKIPIHWLDGPSGNRIPAIELRLLDNDNNEFARVHALIDLNWEGDVYLGHSTLAAIRLQPDLGSRTWLELNPRPFSDSLGYVQLSCWSGNIALEGQSESQVEVLQGYRGMSEQAKLGAKFLKRMGLVLVYDPQQEDCSVLARST